MKKKILILGGTKFIGRNLVEKLSQQSNYEIVLFNRGQSQPDLFPAIQRITGDRNVEKDLAQIFATNWDYIIDISCYFPQSLSWVLNKVNRNITKYIFVSTCSVYDSDGDSGILRQENAPILECTDEEAIDPSTATYGKRKAACESLLENSNIPFIIFRPALVFGPYDYTDRFYYWLHQAKTKKQIIVPENGARKLSLTYVDDLINAISDALQQNNVNKIYNCISYPEMSIKEILNTALLIFNRDVERINVSADFLKEENISEWFDLPLWLNTDIFTFSNELISAETGFEAIPIVKSISNTIDYFNNLGYPKPTYGIDQKKQEELITKLKPNG